ncbi:TetR/AcrR family transcriptional regulator [Sinomonas notoginsengisoli]|uniref:TetR/AcrR family transcriptional regulator n=1 Tax=Sinomonas notoginsengisoli TaxID=1457311 RepID=UPI001F459F0E|nr:TetR/AcrR family transcriptional regulator [Sinomonas notoginsengisoli]
MGRWEPNARGRLAQAALTLYNEKGFDATTVAEISARAGLSERTFFRHFPDKREVLFSGTEMVRDLLARTIAEVPATAAPVQAVGAALGAVCGIMQEDPERVRLRDSVVSAHTELRERELIKLAMFASVMTEALIERGVSERVANLAAEQGVAIFKVAFALWVRGPDGSKLTDILHELMAEARGVLGAVSRPHSCAGGSSWPTMGP